MGPNQKQKCLLQILQSTLVPHSYHNWNLLLKYVPKKIFEDCRNQIDKQQTIILTFSYVVGFLRAQYTEKYIQDRVAAELAKLEKQTISSFKEATDNAILKDDPEDQKLSVAATNDKIAKLTNTLKENALLGKVVIPQNVEESRNAVISCLKENQGKSLNCWEEVETFKRLVKDL